MQKLMTQSSEKHTIEISPTPAHPGVKGTFGRITVFLGANGSGKSSFLRDLSRNFGSNANDATFSPVYVEGNRVIEFKDDASIRSHAAFFSRPNEEINTYYGGKLNPFTTRLKSSIALLRGHEFHQKQQYLESFEKWDEGGQNGPKPPKGLRPFSRLAAMFESIFPDLRIEITAGEQIYVRKGADQYPVNGLSDGEKQVLALMADIVCLSRPKSVFFVDEPELHLHPMLAEDLWNSIETAYPESKFFYATHNISFALRNSVESRFVLGQGEIQVSENLENNEGLRPLLGALPTVLRAKRCLFVEGNETSIDQPLYSWMFSSPELKVIPVSGCADVIAAAGRVGVWKSIAPATKIAGIIDGDYRHDSEELPPNVLCLPFHEAESILCHPQLLLAIAGKLQNTVNPVTKEQIMTLLVENAKNQLLNTIANRVFARCRLSLAIALSRSGLSQISSLDDLQYHIAHAGSKEQEKARQLFSESSVERLFEEESLRCKSAIQNQDIEGLLKLFPAKQLVFHLSKLAGCKGPAELIVAAKNHLDPADLELFKSIRDSFEQLF